MLSEKADSIQKFLLDRNIESRVVEFSESTRTAADAAAAIGCEVAQIAKSLIFKTKETHRPVLVVASGPNRVNEQILAMHIGEDMEKADADFVHDVTGFAIGGVSPVGHKSPIDLVFIDEDLLKFEAIWAAAGTPHAVFNLDSQSLVSLSKGQIIKIG